MTAKEDKCNTIVTLSMEKTYNSLTVKGRMKPK